MSGDSVRGQLDSRGRPRRWLVADWVWAAGHLGVRVPADWGISAAASVEFMGRVCREAKLQLDPSHAMRRAIQEQMDLPF